MFVKKRDAGNAVEYWDIWNQKVVSVKKGEELGFEVLEDEDEVYKYTRNYQLTKYEKLINSAKSYQEFIESTTE